VLLKTVSQHAVLVPRVASMDIGLSYPLVGAAWWVMLSNSDSKIQQHSGVEATILKGCCQLVSEYRWHANAGQVLGDRGILIDDFYLQTWPWGKFFRLRLQSWSSIHLLPFPFPLLKVRLALGSNGSFNFLFKRIEFLFKRFCTSNPALLSTFRRNHKKRSVSVEINIQMEIWNWLTQHPTNKGKTIQYGWWGRRLSCLE
jgi:hypothetical protein